MAAPTWTYADWITYPTGSATRVSRLRLHIVEVDQALRALQAEYAIKGRELDPKMTDLQRELSDLRKQEEKEAEMADLASGARLGWTKGRARL